MVRFDQPCISVAGAVEYFRDHMDLGDYLTEHGKAEMTWAGAGATHLGLSGQCQIKDFENLCRGRHPESALKLMVRDKGVRRRVCFFGQISAPKDVSLLYLVGGDERIGRWWHEAVADTLQEIEAVTASRVRRDGANEDRVTGNMVAAIVTHEASRAMDPQLHTHLCIMNLTHDAAEDRWKSVQPEAFFRHQGYFREVCYSHLARRMTAAGYQLDSLRSVGFNVQGVPSSLRERFSKRRRQILQRAAALGAVSQDSLQAITAESRAVKSAADLATLRKRWIEEAGDELSLLRSATRPGKKQRAVFTTPREALKSAEAHVFERSSVVDVRLLLREALVAGRGQTGLESLKRALSARVSSSDLVRVDDEIASREGLDAERELVSLASRGRPAVESFGKTPSLEGLADDQKAAVRGVLNARNELVVVQGDAGTGKTKCLKTIVRGIEDAGGEVFGCAPSSGATEVLRHELRSDADTLQKLLASEELQRRVRGRVIIVDEAGLVSVREMRDLCRLAARNAHRLLLVGDIKQHHSVEAGDALRCLQEFARVPVFRLTEIRRQSDPEYRKAVARLAAGDAFGAFNRFDRLGAVRGVANPGAMFAAAAEDYVRTIRSGKSCLAISPVWSEIHDFTREVRRQMRAAGQLLGEEQTFVTVHSLKWTREERRRPASYQPGDRIVFHRATGRYSKHEMLTVVRREEHQLVVQDEAKREFRIPPRHVSGFDVGLAKETPLAVGDRLLLRGNLAACRLKNGDLAEVAGLGRDGVILLKDGREIPAWFREFSHGYGATSHASQGKTVDRGLLLLADEGIAAGNLKQSYVSNSRFRESNAIYTTDKTAARDAMMRTSDRKLALEFAAGAGRESPSKQVHGSPLRTLIVRKPSSAKQSHLS